MKIEINHYRIAYKNAKARLDTINAMPESAEKVRMLQQVPYMEMYVALYERCCSHEIRKDSPMGLLKEFLEVDDKPDLKLL